MGPSLRVRPTGQTSGSTTVACEQDPGAEEVDAYPRWEVQQDRGEWRHVRPRDALPKRTVGRMLEPRREVGTRRLKYIPHEVLQDLPLAGLVQRDCSHTRQIRLPSHPVDPTGLQDHFSRGACNRQRRRAGRPQGDALEADREPRATGGPQQPYPC